MYCVYGNSSWYIDCCPLYGRCPLLRVSVIGISTVIGFGEHKLVLPALIKLCKACLDLHAKYVPIIGKLVCLTGCRVC